MKALRSNILDLLYKGKSEEFILNEIVLRAQRVSSGAICSILCLDEEGKHLLLRFSPDLPDFYNKAINNFPIGLGNGSCGTSAFTGKRVIVEDVNTHPYWKNSRKLAQKAGLASCWSEPIKDPLGKILGTFAIYHSEIYYPNEADMIMISELASITGIVLDRYGMIRKLEESENKYKTLASASNEAVFIVEGDKIVDVNKRAEIISGYSEKELATMSIFKFIGREYWFTPYTTKAQQFRHKIKAEGITKNKIRKEVVVHIKNSIFKGKEVCLLSIRDVSNQIRVENEFRKLSQSVIQSPTSVVITDFNGDIEYVNPKFEELTGYSLGELKGEKSQVLSSGFIPAESYQSLWQEIKVGNVWRGEFQNLKKNGEQFWEFATVSALKNDEGEITNFIAVKEDISERKRQEQIQQIILNISNAVFSQNTLVEFIHFIRQELSAIIDTTNFFVALYDHEKQLFNMPYHDDEYDSVESFPKGKSLSGWVVDHEEVLMGTVDRLDELERLGEVELAGEPSKIWLGMPLKGKEKIIGVLVIQSYDDENAVSENDREMLELVSHQISISIEQKRTEQELHKALKDATESDRLKSVFLATMSHELRTPLNAVIGFSELVDEDISMDLAIEYCKMINQSGLNLLNIVEDLFDISLIQSGAVKIEKKKCRLEEILHEVYAVIKMEQQALDKECIELKMVLPDGYQHLVFETDPNRFKQIFQNLLKNALKFTDKGFIEFGMQQNDLNSNIPFTFFVKDTGVGIPDEKKNNIFGIFRQANESLARTYNGVGIGLSISKSLSELLGGKIWLESQVGLGTTFYFTHPINKD
ncbi:GAF domain-containing protein [Marinifilum sp. RC60d5]|uniref:GAF domain-containing protein n=1 Tax=Marinifilum sp. RC60d5 TaxID=3458414 RepID=UPI0040355539